MKSITKSRDWGIFGLNYDNDADGFLCLGLPGAVEARRVIQVYADRCPDTKIVFGGYSQGAMLVHNASQRRKVRQAPC